MSSPTASLNILIYKGILTLVLQGFKRFYHYPLTNGLNPPLTRLLPGY